MTKRKTGQLQLQVEAQKVGEGRLGRPTLKLGSRGTSFENKALGDGLRKGTSSVWESHAGPRAPGRLDTLTAQPSFLGFFSP